MSVQKIESSDKLSNAIDLSKEDNNRSSEMNEQQLFTNGNETSKDIVDGSNEGSNSDSGNSHNDSCKFFLNTLIF